MAEPEASDLSETVPMTADEARARLAEHLRTSGLAPSDRVQQAFAVVPRHIFVPEKGFAEAYRDEAFVLKCGPDGAPVSASSQPAIMAIMLEQLGINPGQRILEVGTGSGYNAALMSFITGEHGRVVTLDIDPDLIARARLSLQEAGFDAVDVVCGDGGYGDPDSAPFDRIIVTAGVWDVAPAWLDQLAEDGRLVLPLSVRGIEVCVALERGPGCWRSGSCCRCGFVRMLGAFASPVAPVPITGPEPLSVQRADGVALDPQALETALAGPSTDIPAGVLAADQAEAGDLDLWLTYTQPDLERLTLMTAAGRHSSPMPMGGLLRAGTDPARIGIATILPVGPDASKAAPAEVVVRGYGPGGAALAGHLADRALAWSERGRPGAADLQLSLYPAGGGRPEDGGLLVLDRPHAAIVNDWPERA
jgi:protein-L-isoaspartate(D-aspartate) O-methyltransferase